MTLTTGDVIAKRQRIFLFRHGETEWSLAGRHTGKTDVPLTAHGEQQARALRPWIAATAFSHVLASPRARAIATCQLCGASSQAEIDPDLMEWDYGAYDGRRTVDIVGSRPGWNLFLDGCPNGETPADVGVRADRLIARLRTMSGDIALFSHGQFGAVLGARWIGLALAEARHFSLDPASMSVLSFDPDHLEVAVIALWNATPTPAP
ncbi:histidine phosphatase family protein [Rhodoblastus sphagnicola]|uniref:Histidine phosphatase family protein n=1 Tax=Rhodoblastus sphagnicola TaxID=333368 RepID=A0A2S6MVF4_9HYPH|nr:histidine phosphatase family protein [Rhodoblastus sphagnicola]MBB4197568.1 putative phosphoglycerate mutase [Rhodoblastus sphagnicola]PPQ26344.1 histidine phosphatase family protein [Rhodoblastus sphagnicola]